ncbi:VCBS repeat-containing protein [Monaibacterium marinum]|uniref:VCBS repeat-containing protein n=1 Tax=Pontivivens marinum TaxID=1690039 RepID=A0A2C9CQC4_9RHOB|nr:Ig-like domain-containing protein [Monaibacterium marinum]SOH92569.1 VCBS repeat-containing protein [Monaibacterium marinum]
MGRSSNYSWNSFTVIDENSIRTDSNFSTGDSFTYSGADATMYVSDNDSGLAGDSGRNANEQGSDNQSGWLNEDGNWTDAGNVYWEGYFVVHGDDGNTYYMIEIEGTNLPDGGNDHFAFYGAVPAQGVELTAACYYGDCGSLSYACLDGGEIGSHASAPDADDDFLAVMQGEGFGDNDINVLLNDASNTSEALVVKEIDGSASLVGVWIDLEDGGRVLVAADGSVDFDAAGDFDALGAGETATVSLDYTVLNSDGLTDTATLTIEVTGVNDAPVAVDQAVRTSEDEAVTGNVMDGAFDVDGDVVTLDGTSLGAIGEAIEVTTANGYTGTVVVNADGTYTYTPGADANDMAEGETDTFSFDFTVKSQDGFTTIDSTRTIDFEEFNTGETITNQIDGVTINVHAYNKCIDEAMIFDSNNPTGGDWDLATDTQGNLLIISEDGHEWDPDDNAAGGEIRFSFDEPTDVSSLTIVDNEEGVWIGFFDENWCKTGEQWVSGGSNNSINEVALNGVDVSYMVVVLKGSGGIDDLVLGSTEEVPAYVYDTATVTVTIDGASDGPVISVENDTNTTDEDTAVSGNILENDATTEGTLAVSAIEGGVVGESFEVTSEGGLTGLLTVNADGSYTFEPNEGFEELNDGDVDTISLNYTATATTTVATPDDRLIVNGDFEGGGSELLFNTSGTDGQWNYLDQDLVEGWSVLEGDIELQSGNVGGSENIDTNNTVAELDARFNSTLYQDVYAGSDGSFELSLDFYARALNGEIDDTSGVSVLVDGVVVATLNSDDLEKKSLTVNFDLTEGDHRIAFEGLPVSDSYGGRIDNVVMTRTSGETAGETASADGTLTITVTGVTDNVAPVVEVVAALTDEATPVSGNLLDDATDADGDVITVESITAGALGEGVSVTTDGGNTGTLIVNADGSFTFTPDGVDLDMGQTDTITFGYTATDGQATASSTATITITGLNEGPVATAQSFAISEQNAEGQNSTAAGNLLNGATDADGDTITVSGISAGALGETLAVTTAAGVAALLTVAADGSFTLSSADDSMDLGETDSYTFDFTVVSSGGVTDQFDTQTATVTIAGVNVGPAAQNIDLSMDEASTAPTTPNAIDGDLLAGAVDADGDAMSLQSTTLGAIGGTRLVTTEGGQSGLLQINDDGTFTFTSTSDALDLTETDTLTFDYTIASSGGTTVQTDTKTVTITINGLNDAPVAISQSITLNEMNDQGLTSTAAGNLLFDATDIDGDTLVLASTTVGTIGDTVSVTTDGGRTGELTINTDGTFSFVSTDDSLDLGEADSITFDFTVESTGGVVTQSDTATATININGVNVAPVTVNSTFQISEANDQGLSNVVTGNLLDGATDADGDAITVFSTSVGAVGETVIVTTTSGHDAELTIGADGSFTLTALDSSMDLNESDMVVIEFTAVSSGGVTQQFSSSQATININGVNVAPIAGDVGVVVFEQNNIGEISTVSGDLLANSTDADGDAISLVSTSLGAIGEAVAVTTTEGGTGLLTINADGTFTYVSTSTDLDQDQPDFITFEFTVESTGGTTVQSSTATATIDINGINSPPIAIDQAYTTDEDTELLNVNIMDGASDPDGDAVTLAGISDGMSLSTSGRFGNVVANNIITDNGLTGTLTVFVDGSMRYQPSAQAAEIMNAGDIDTFTFQYTVESSDGGVVQTDTKSVTVTITGADDAAPNTPPVATGQIIEILETEVATGDLSALVTDNDIGDTITIETVAGQTLVPGAAIELTSAGKGWTGTLTVEADGTFAFDPSDQFLALNDGQSEIVSFNYSASDAAGEGDSATIEIVVNGEGSDAGVSADVNYYFLIDASASMFVNVASLDCDFNGDGSTSWIDLSIEMAGQLGEVLPTVWDNFSDLSTSSSYFTYGSTATEIGSPYDIDGSLASSSNLSGALTSLQSEMDENADNRVFIFTGGGSSSTGAEDAVEALVDDYNATISTYAIGAESGLGGLLDDLLDVVGLDGDTPTIDDCDDIPQEVLDAELALVDELFFIT